MPTVFMFLKQNNIFTELSQFVYSTVDYHYINQHSSMFTKLAAFLLNYKYFHRVSSIRSKLAVFYEVQYISVCACATYSIRKCIDIDNQNVVYF